MEVSEAMGRLSMVRRIVAALALVTALAAGQMARPARAATTFPYTRIINVASNKCLDHSNYGTGLYAIVYTCNGRANQVWELPDF
jgi:hypothetical protein